MDIGSAFGMVLALGFVLALIVGGAWLVRKFGGPLTASSGPFKVLASISLGGRERAVLIQVGSEQMLLGVSPGSVRNLGKLDNPIDVPDTAVFAQTLANSLGRGKS